jgi:hypothetical protein
MAEYPTERCLQKNVHFKRWTVRSNGHFGQTGRQLFLTFLLYSVFLFSFLCFDLIIKHDTHAKTDTSVLCPTSLVYPLNFWLKFYFVRIEKTLSPTSLLIPCRYLSFSPSYPPTRFQWLRLYNYKYAACLRECGEDMVVLWVWERCL